MRGKIFVPIILFLTLLVSVSAGSTTVNLKTLPHHTVLLTPIQVGGGFDALAIPLTGFTSQYGDVKFSFDIDKLVYDLNIIVKNGSRTVFREKITENFIANIEIDIVSLPKGIEPIETPEPEEYIPSESETNITENVTENITGNLTQEINTENKGIKKIILSGYSIVEENQPVINTIYYSLLGITALLLIFLMLRQNTKKVNEKSKISIPQDDEEELEGELSKTKQKLSELQNRKKQKIDDVKRQLIEDEKKLMRLRGQRTQEKNNSDNEN